MTSNATTIDEYLESLPEDRRDAVNKLREVIKTNIPEGFEERISYNVIGFVVPHSLHPAGYHCDPKLPLPFINIASQKNFVALYHMGLYGDPKLLRWFTEEFPKHSKSKLDMGKSCVRFKKMDDIPFELIAQLARKVTVEQWIKWCTEGVAALRKKAAK